MSGKAVVIEEEMTKAERNPTALYCDEPSMTKQSFKDECDINLIVQRAVSGADISHVNSRVAQYGDFTNIPDFQAALDMVNRAHGMFMSLDGFVRERFSNDPAKMVSFLNDPKNRDEAIRLGLVNPPSESKQDASEGALEEVSEATSVKRAPGAPGKKA